MSKEITMELVKLLRDKTLVGMMDCKKALIEAEGDIEKAIEILRKKGAAVAAKRAENVTNNGHIEAVVTADQKTGALVKISCETDFSANTKDMKNFATNICNHIIKAKPSDLDTLLNQPMSGQEKLSVKDTLNDLIAKIGEKITVSQFCRFQVEKEGVVDFYIHPGANVGILLELDYDKKAADIAHEEIKILAHDICMQIAVTDPIAISPDKLAPELIEKEMNIIKEQLANSGKPANMIEKIALGKLNKYYEEACLVNQKFIKDDKTTVQDQINQVTKKTGINIKVKQFARFAIGK